MEEENKMSVDLYKHLQIPMNDNPVLLGGYLKMNDGHDPQKCKYVSCSPKRSKKIKSQQDSRKKSASEAFVNSFGSYPIGYVLGIIILPISMGWLQDDLFIANLFVTLIYATVSFVRTYYLRRIFERLGFDDNFIRLFTKIRGKITKNYKKNPK